MKQGPGPVGRGAGPKGWGLRPDFPVRVCPALTEPWDTEPGLTVPWDTEPGDLTEPGASFVGCPSGSGDRGTSLGLVLLQPQGSLSPSAPETARRDPCMPRDTVLPPRPLS